MRAVVSAADLQHAAALVEAVGAEIVGVKLPDLAVLGAGGFQWFAVRFGKRLGAAALARHRRVEAGHSFSMSCATLGARSRVAILLPSSKLSSARNFNLA